MGTLVIAVAADRVRVMYSGVPKRIVVGFVSAQVDLHKKDNCCCARNRQTTVAVYVKFNHIARWIFFHRSLAFTNGLLYYYCTTVSYSILE